MRPASSAALLAGTALLAAAAGGPAFAFRPRPAMAAAAADPSVVTLNAPSEPGQPLVFAGRVLGSDGAPVAGARVLAFQTDAAGLYTPGPRDDPQQARLRGTAVTGPDGRFEFRTIRPAPYPRGGVPAHIHCPVTAPGGATQDFEIVFEGDPAVTAGMRAQSARGGPFLVRPLAGDATGWRVEADLRLK